MLKRFLQIRDHLTEASNETNVDIPIDIATSFASKTKKYQRMLSEIDFVAKNLQICGHTLQKCREGLKHC